MCGIVFADSTVIIPRSLCWPFRFGLRLMLPFMSPHAIIMMGHEPDVSRILKKVKGKVFFDIGCNFGYYVQLLKDNFREIIGFEADPEIAEEARRYAPRNAMIRHLAVSDADGFTYLHRNPKNLNGAYTVAGSGYGGIKVPSGRVADYIPKDSVVDLVKVDVEGAEWLVLKGAEPRMPQIKRWMIELHDLGRQKELESYLQGYGYRTFWLKNNRSLPHLYAVRCSPKSASLD
jgi:FkbM family methyltransferase